MARTFLRVAGSVAVILECSAATLTATPPTAAKFVKPLVSPVRTVQTKIGLTVHSAMLVRPVRQMIPIPSALGTTSDLAVCTAHGGLGGGLACKALMPAGGLPLVWTCHTCSVSGYRLYRVDGGQHSLVPPSGAYATDPTVTLAVLPNAATLAGSCYVVTAFSGAGESDPSAAYCAGAGSIAQTTTLSPTQASHWGRTRDLRTGALGYTDPPNDYYDNQLWVGYGDDYTENPFGDVYSDGFNRTGLLFDLSALAGRRVSDAHLKLSAFASYHDYSDNGIEISLSDETPDVCVAYVDLATDRWWQNNDFSSSTAYLAPGGFTGPDFSIDVTSAVARWANADPTQNFGFLLRGADENDQWHGPSNHVCDTILQSASLVVTYY